MRAHSNNKGIDVSETVSVVFRGQLLPGVSLEEAKAHATLAFKLSPEKCDAMFGGRPVILRKGLPKAELDTYLQRLQRVGLQVEVRPDAPADAAPPAAAPATMNVATAPATNPAAATSQVAAPAAGLAGLSLVPMAEPAAEAPPAAPAAEEMTCPQCGEVQPKRTLCRACSVDMPRFAAAVEQAAQEARAEERAAREGAPRTAAMRAALRDEDRASFIGLSFDQRISRTTFLLSFFIGTAVMIFAMAIPFKLDFSIGSAVFALLSVLAIVVWSIRMNVLRLHDLGWSGWLYLINFVPIPFVGLIFFLILACKRGKEEDNEWGSLAPASSGAGIVFSGLACFIALAIFIKTYGMAMQNPAVLAALGKEVPTARGELSGSAAGGNPLAGFDPQRNDIVLFTANGCKACEAMHDTLRGAGLHFTERFIDRDADSAQDLMDRLNRAGIDAQRANLPLLAVNSKLLENPTPGQIALYLKR
ncbi:DUF805 domain-containing protein [Viridibacterium curvum]|uniref:DUF805 domain-containing protein n=1 Tax=Viridibacterium curvum TaxID=1101404 RepID=A0ABP9QPU8_9RHOO